MFRYVIALSLVIPAAALAQANPPSTGPAPANPSRPDLMDADQAQHPKSDAPSKDTQMDRGVDAKPEGAAAAPIPGPAKATGEFSDAEVLSRLHHANALEAKCGQIGAERGKSADVRSYGAKLVRDHAAADAELTGFVDKVKIGLHTPRPISAEDAKQITATDMLPQQLRALPAAQFDREFAANMLQTHSDAIAMVEQARATTKSAAIKGYYDNALPMLRMHRDRAADILATIETQPATGSSGSMDEDKSMDKGSMDKTDIKSDTDKEGQ